jgi:glycosyltransferase involved in cell wall biosynthesis
MEINFAKPCYTKSDSRPIMRFSVCIPTLNEEKYLPILLEALTNQTHKDFEVIVADGNSEDKTIQIASEFSQGLNLKILESPQRGVSFQRNYAAKHAQSEHLIFFDADTKPGPKFLGKINLHLANHKVDTLTCWNTPISNNILDKIIWGVYNIFCLSALQKIYPVATIGTFIYMKKSVFEALGGFNEAMSYGEDSKLVFLAAKAGYIFTVLSDPVIPFSIRRIQKEGRLKFYAKTLTWGAYYYVSGKWTKEARSGAKHEFGKHV